MQTSILRDKLNTLYLDRPEAPNVIELEGGVKVFIDHTDRDEPIMASIPIEGEDQPRVVKVFARRRDILLGQGLESVLLGFTRNGYYDSKTAINTLTSISTSLGAPAPRPSQGQYAIG